MLKLSLFES